MDIQNQVSPVEVFPRKITLFGFTISQTYQSIWTVSILDPSDRAALSISRSQTVPDLMERAMYGLLVANIPHDCEQDEIRSWIEAHGVRVQTLKLISDLVSRTSPEFARVQLENARETDKAASILDGQRLRKSVLRVEALNL